MSSGEKQHDLETERRYVADLYGYLDAERAAASTQLNADHDGGALWERDAKAAHWSGRLSQLRAAEHGLCFGRVDRADGTRSYIGRIGLFEDESEEPLLTDWRAPTARPFYCATPATPEGIARRRHFRTRGRTLLDFHDDVFTASPERWEDAGADNALFSALEATRDGSMRDIVSTIQAEQDEIIRLDCPGVLVIEGGPGTGKTAVALHRVAYLLYHHRERLSRRGVLVVGPNTDFLRYIGSVLPSLGETDVVFTDPGALYPGVVTTEADDVAAARIKGSTAMVEVLRRAVADRQEIPAEAIEIALDDVTLRLDSAVVSVARERARATGLQHNPARRVFREQLGALLVDQAVRRIGAGWLDPDDPPELHDDIAAEVREELRAHPVFHEAVEDLWPVLTPRRLLAELFASRARLCAAADGTTELDSLYREVGEAWTVADAALLDEVAELLGVDTTEQRRHKSRQKQAERHYAQEVLWILDSHDDQDDSEVRPGDVVNASDLDERQAEPDHRELAERAVADRDWTYGHLVVDEAQELSPMVWRVLMRRCPGRSATVVGDLAQRHSPAADADWSATLSPYIGHRWTYRRLSINYRTPAEIMKIATSVLRETSADSQGPQSIRHGDRPWHQRVEPGALSDAVRESVEHEAAADDRSIAVIAASATLRDIKAPARAVCVTPQESKGREFDVVLVLEPNEILRSGARGAADLYVTLTRATRRLGVLHTAELPECMADDGTRWSAG